MNEYIVTVVIGTEYLYLVQANTEAHAHAIIGEYDQTPNDPNAHLIDELESEAGRAITDCKVFHRPTCPTCEETIYDCEAHSEYAFQVKDALTTLAATCNETMSEYIHEALNAYLIHGISPCNAESKA